MLELSRHSKSSKDAHLSTEIDMVSFSVPLRKLVVSIGWTPWRGPINYQRGELYYCDVMLGTWRLNSLAKREHQFPHLWFFCKFVPPVICGFSTQSANNAESLDNIMYRLIKNIFKWSIFEVTFENIYLTLRSELVWLPSTNLSWAQDKPTNIIMTWEPRLVPLVWGTGTVCVGIINYHPVFLAPFSS